MGWSKPSATCARFRIAPAARSRASSGSTPCRSCDRASQSWVSSTSRTAEACGGLILVAAFNLHPRVAFLPGQADGTKAAAQSVSAGARDPRGPPSEAPSRLGLAAEGCRRTARRRLNDSQQLGTAPDEALPSTSAQHCPPSSGELASQPMRSQTRTQRESGVAGGKQEPRVRLLRERGSTMIRLRHPGRVSAPQRPKLCRQGTTGASTTV